MGIETRKPKPMNYPTILLLFAASALCAEERSTPCEQLQDDLDAAWIDFQTYRSSLFRDTVYQLTELDKERLELEIETYALIYKRTCSECGWSDCELSQEQIMKATLEDLRVRGL